MRSHIIALLIAALLALGLCPALAEGPRADIEVLMAMGEAGSYAPDIENSAPEYGLYGFIDYPGYMTMNVDPDDASRLLGPISFRITTENPDEISGVFFPMVKTLLSFLAPDGLSGDDLEALGQYEAMGVEKSQRLEVCEETRQLNDWCALKFAVSSNGEVYFLFTPTADTPRWQME